MQPAQHNGISRLTHGMLHMGYIWRVHIINQSTIEDNQRVITGTQFNSIHDTNIYLVAIKPQR